MDDFEPVDAFNKFYASLLPKPASTLLLFDRGDFFSVYDEDARFVAETIFHTSTVIKYFNNNPRSMAYVTLTRLAAESLIRDALLNFGFRVCVYTQSGSTWTCTKQGSPGNIQAFEDLFNIEDGMVAAPVVAALRVSQKNDERKVGLAFIDATHRHFGLCEYVDNDLFSNTETLLLQLSVRECVIPEDSSYDSKKISSILNRCGIVVTEKKKGAFHSKDIEQDLSRLVADQTVLPSLSQNEYGLALISLGCLINYLEVLSDETNFNSYALQKHSMDQFLKLDAAAVKALNLFPGPNDGANKTMSLFGLLNKCKTAQGTRLLSQWIKQPLADMAQIVTRHKIVETFVNNPESRQKMQELHIKNVPDLSRLAKRFQKGSAGLQDVVRFYQVSIRLPGLISELTELTTLTDDAEMKELLEGEFIKKLESYLGHLEKLQGLTETTIDLNKAENHEYVIKAEFDADLQNLKQQLDEVLEQISPEYVKTAHNLNMEPDKKLKLDKNNQYGFFMRLPRADAGVLKNRGDYIELTTQKSGVFFTTRKLRELSSQYVQLSDEYEKKQAALVKEVITVVSTRIFASKLNFLVSFIPIMEHLNEIYAHLDVLVSFAHVSVHAPVPYARPAMHPMGTGQLKLEGARHPCIELQDDVNFIPNQVEMNYETARFAIITGPNMGGKSTYIRQIGVIALMAQIGCFVPCSYAEIPIFDAILARVGAGDCQLKGISTFMAEMLETAAILKSASHNSLIIIDELGRGTSTYDGFGLAWSVSEHIAREIRALCLFATHFHELTDLSNQLPYVKNLNVLAHTSDNHIALLYKVQEGTCDQSFGIHVAELARFPNSVIKMAKRKACALEAGGEDAKGCDESVIEGGLSIMDQYMKQMASLEYENMTDAELKDAMKQIHGKYAGGFNGNAFLANHVLQ